MKWNICFWLCSTSAVGDAGITFPSVLVAFIFKVICYPIYFCIFKHWQLGKCEWNYKWVTYQLLAMPPPLVSQSSKYMHYWGCITKRFYFSAFLKFIEFILRTKSFKILCNAFWDFGGFNAVETSHNFIIWGSMSQFSSSTKNDNL